MENTLIKYIRNREDEPIGAVAAVRIGDSVGVSCCLVHKTDREHISTKEQVRSQAISRAVLAKPFPIIPRSISGEYEKMLRRAQSYFKGCEVIPA